MATTAMRVKTTTATDGKSTTKTISPLAFATGDGITADDRGKAIKYVAQRIVALTTNTYGETDMIVTTNVDSITEVTNVG